MNGLFVDTLKRHKLNITKERRILFELLDTQSEPRTMQQLIRAAAPSLDRSTVYRTIELFENIGICTRVYTGWKYRVELSDRFSSHHHHITCRNCGMIIAFDEPASLHHELHALETSYGFKVESHSLELRGLCTACQRL